MWHNFQFMSQSFLFKWISRLEALSFILLLGIAMPLKYIWGDPSWVQEVGMFHGVLFLAYIGLAIFLSAHQHWSKKQLLIVMLCSLLPFGPFYVEKKYEI